MKTIVMLVNMTWYWFIGTILYKLNLRGEMGLFYGIGISSIVSYLLAFVYGRVTANSNDE